MRLPDGYRRTPPPGLMDEDGGVDDEIRFHIESRIAELIEGGTSESEAMEQARSEFGHESRTARQVRKASGTGGGIMMWRRWLEEGLRDIAVGVRQLRRNVGFAATAIVTISVGIAGTTAIYSVVDAVLFRTLPYPDESRVARVWQVAPGDTDGGRSAWSVPDVDDWRDRSTTLTAIGAYTTFLGGLVVSTDGGPEEVSTAYVTRGFFEAMGTPAWAGRPLAAESEERQPREVVLSDGFWRRRFGADPAVVGTILNVQGGGYEIVGVMPRGFDFPEPEVELWTFLANVDQQSVPWLQREVRFLNAVARVSGDATIESATGELGAVAKAIARDLPETSGGLAAAELLPIREAIVGDVRLPLLLMAGAVVLTLLIACANVANLLLARGASRGDEFALRSSLGASQGRLGRQLIAESLLLGVIGGGMGLLLASGLIRLLVSRAGDLLPRASTVALDARVVGFALVLSIATGLLFGLLPAWRVGGAASGSGGGRRTAGVESRRLLDTLVFAEVCLAVVLLVGGGLLMRSFADLRAVDPGFEVDGLLVADLVVSGERYSSAQEYLGFRDRVVERLEGLPGVIQATSAKNFPSRGMGEQMPWSLPGDPPALPGEERTAMGLNVDRDFFTVMGIPILRGSTPADDIELALVINERLAIAAFGDIDSAVGSSLQVAGRAVPVRAVVGDVLHADPASPPPAMIYLDDRIMARRVFSIIVRSDQDPLLLVEPLRRVFADLDPEQPVRSIYTARSAYDDAVGQPRFFALLMGMFAGGAALLAAIGIYGVVSYSVRRRTREIGVRIALGADRGRVRSMIVREALRPVLPGVVVGLAAAAAMSSLLTSLLFQVGRTDLLTYSAVGVGLLVVATLASLGPAIEATRVDPQTALRTE